MHFKSVVLVASVHLYYVSLLMLLDSVYENLVFDKGSFLEVIHHSDWVLHQTREQVELIQSKCVHIRFGLVVKSSFQVENNRVIAHKIATPKHMC